MDLSKYDKNLTTQKVPNYKMVKFFKLNIPHMNLLSCIIHILSPNNKFGI
jgi:hypothetical protein